MTRRRQKSGPISATDLIAQLEQDHQYQADRAAFKEGLDERTARLHAAEEPILDDLRRRGIDVESVWDLVNTSEPYPAALPALIDHLERGGYPDRVMAGLARALAVKPAIRYWSRIKTAFVSASGPAEREGLAACLAAMATKAQIDDLLDLVSQADQGVDRVFFLRPIFKLGGKTGRAVIESLQADPELGKEAAAILRERE